MINYLTDPIFLIPACIMIHAAIYGSIWRVYGGYCDFPRVVTSIALVVVLFTHALFMIVEATKGVTPRTMTFVFGLLLAHLLFYFFLPKKK